MKRHMIQTRRMICRHCGSRLAARLRVLESDGQKEQRVHFTHMTVLHSEHCGTTHPGSEDNSLMKPSHTWFSD